MTEIDQVKEFTDVKALNKWLADKTHSRTILKIYMSSSGTYAVWYRDMTMTSQPNAKL